jgi:Q_tRNA_tgt: queuine tRNA-ribosyltransferase
MTISLLEHPLGAQPGQPGDRSAFHFETITRLPSTASGLGRDGARYGRTGIIHTPHGDIRTPAFVPVGTQAAMKAVLPEQMKDLGAQCLLANAFHLFERPGEDVLDAAGGLARFMNWDGPTFTDSGGFQVMSLGVGFKKTLAMDVTGMKSDDIIAKGKERMAWVDEDGVTFKSPLNGDAHRFSAEISMGIQHKIGADIMFAFDELTTLMNTRSYQEDSVERTFRWARRCVDEHQRLTAERLGKPYQALYGVVQGANYEDLRRRAASQIASLDFDGVGIGGAIEKRIIGDTCAWIRDAMPENRPRHVLGIASVDDIFACVENGGDTFDCVGPRTLRPQRRDLHEVGPIQHQTRPAQVRFRPAGGRMRLLHVPSLLARIRRPPASRTRIQRLHVGHDSQRAFLREAAGRHPRLDRRRIL